MEHRHEVSDEQWNIVGPLISAKSARTGRPRRDARTMFNGVLWILRTGAPWRDLSERYGPWQTVYAYFKTWRSNGAFDRVLEALQVRLDREGKIDWDLFCIDGSNVRAARAAAGASKKVSAVTATSRKTMRWAVRGADSAASSTWSRMVRASPSPLK